MALNDPERKEATIKDLLESAVIIEDENGRKQRIISIGGLYVDGKFFSMGRDLNNLQKMPLLDEDVILATCPKTGTK